MEELTELYEIAEWAVYHGYREISAKTLVEIMAKGGTIGRHSVLEKRLSFDGYIYSLNADVEGRPSKLLDSLKFLEELQQTYSSECCSDSTNEYHWLRIRQLTVMQLALLKLKDQLRMDPTDYRPIKPSEITIPKTFQVAEFEREVDELFTKHKKYTSSTVLGKIEDYTAEVLREHLMKPFNKDPNKIKYGVHHLLNMYPIETFRYEASTFAKTVEREKVLPPTSHFYPQPSHQTDTKAASSETPAGVTPQVWDEKRRDSSGPYVLGKPKDNIVPDEVDTDEQNSQNEVITRKARTNTNHPDNAALKNLQEQKSTFQASNAKHDPLSEALGISSESPDKSHHEDPIPGQVQSRAGNGRKTRSMTSQDNHTPVKKSRLIDSRDTSTEVVWTESESEEAEAKTTKLTIESVKKKNFEPILSKSIASPSTHSVRDKGVRLAWTKDEEDALLAGVSIHGVGNWMAILNDPNLNYRFRGRTNVNLKDKYRNLTS